jgi:putative DNA methylase
MTDHPVKRRKKLIEVAIPLEAINAASAREKSIRHGHPSTLHLWWARRPLAAARAVIFCQMVDDPSAVPEEFPTEEDQENERLRLFALISELVQWENTTNKEILKRGRDEISRSWKRCCEDNANHPEARELFNPKRLPEFHDPFAGGGTLPLEAQRLGLKTNASDLNPVAVLINKAMIEIPPKLANNRPINPVSLRQTKFDIEPDMGTTGLAEDVLYYGELMRKQAKKLIGSQYPNIYITAEMTTQRPDLKHYEGQSLVPIAWIWARTVKSPNPAFSSTSVPLTSTYILSSKKGKEAYVEPVITGQDIRFVVKTGKPENPETKSGTKFSRGASFRCILSGDPITGEYIKKEGAAGRIGQMLMAIVAEGKGGRVYLDPTADKVAASDAITRDSGPTQEIYYDPAKGANNCVLYGLNRFCDLYTNRQLRALNAFCSLLKEIHSQVEADYVEARNHSISCSNCSNNIEPSFYADAVCTYLAFAIDKGANYWSALCAWSTTTEKMMSTFSRQALPMVWDFCEANPFSDSSGNWMLGVTQAFKMLKNLGIGSEGNAHQKAAQDQDLSINKVVSTDPPYYDNIGYADLSEYFYVWLRKSLMDIYPDQFKTLGAPKSEELVSIPSRHGGKEGAESFFIDGMQKALSTMGAAKHPAFPCTIYYAFKQSETTDLSGTTSTGWEAFLEAVVRSGLQINGTWPMRTELTGNLKKSKSVLASSLVLVCDKRSKLQPAKDRNEFKRALSKAIPSFVRNLERMGVAPVDIQQSAIGPGMAIFSSSHRVLNTDDTAMTIKDALRDINYTLDDYLSTGDGELDVDTRFALTFFESFGYEKRDFGDAEGLAKARNVSVEGITRAGILQSLAGKVWLLRRDQLNNDWNPMLDDRLSAWEATQHLIKRLESGGEGAAAELLAKLKKVAGHGDLGANCKDLAYRLYNHCEKTKQAEEARAYNGLVIAWPELERLAASQSTETAVQASLI